MLLWRGGLSERRTAPLGCEAALKPAISFRQARRITRFYDCFARARTGRREQAPSPQVGARPVVNSSPATP
ncbi:hypothetical protein C1Y08_01470 [Pseudomonas sp. FW306-02-F02-AA]|nr:hypothetical protein C1Y07_01445 [Pseudomonas sp. FW306-02-F02-AB]PMZ11540.1 hypothetical protein C1Y06_01695 [Pseudomonas sp. FW306-02-H06C]PMZ17463.1 hypothetical protein C1Y08_01470 [Pseudomonas sp. FW306-02-F02-AA]PMZ21713.1 hypothetical protein C1Y09_11475 [Pseudomonas sp. FW306-02-F08-AA]PMZ25616.1 hypothetical protein C1Y05_22955 [Pseudomonas sp. FW306-02-F04-BA]PMZ35556.1 hypothetical protein C1X99_06540 [Pseudomonas sp. FW306-02-H06B]PMZ40892.1 hypothetical protein C1Y00_08445 [Ps